jgi:membrane associated rhomboid family serine protease
VSQRFLVYPLLFIVATQLVPVLQRDRRWHAAQITQLVLILLAALGAMIFADDITWVWIAWGLFVVFVLAPRLLLRQAVRTMNVKWWTWAGRFVWGESGRLYRAHGAALRLARAGHLLAAETLLDSLAARPMPDVIRGEVRMWKVWLLTSSGEWARAIACYETTESWGSLGVAMWARLHVARAYAETGQFDAALRCLQLVALSPRTLGFLEKEFLRTRTFVLARAGALPAVGALAAAEEQSATWRNLMRWGQPAPVTVALVVVCAGVWLVDKFVFDYALINAAGNMPGAVREGEWWRPVTALFLHANWLHLTMNGSALWMFGAALEKTLGRWRLLAIFLVSGAVANFVSAEIGQYDVSVGASGGIFGLVAAFGVVLYRLRAPLYASVRRRMLMILAGAVVIDFTIGGLEPQIDNFAHAGGFAVGLLLAVVLRKRCVGARHPVS